MENEDEICFLKIQWATDKTGKRRRHLLKIQWSTKKWKKKMTFVFKKIQGSTEKMENEDDICF